MVDEVDGAAMTKAGYRDDDTGGGFSAWVRDLANGDTVHVSFNRDGSGGFAQGDPGHAAWYVGKADPATLRDA